MSSLLELRKASKLFAQRHDFSARLGKLFGAQNQDQFVHAVDQVNLTIHAGEVIGLVGESGCGKSTLARMVAGLQGLSSGERFWKGENITRQASAKERRQRLSIQMVFQDPYASLNARLRVFDSIGEAPLVHGLIGKTEQQDYVDGLLHQVGLDPSLGRRFPHQFSGGQRARIGIARALAVKPELLVCDEAVAALDVSIQAQVLNLFMQLREQLDLTYLFISHDLGVVRHIADRVVIMYLGRIVETAPTQEVFARPNHPYTGALLAETPTLEVKKKNFVAIQGELPSPLHPPSGCHFHPRCPRAAQVPGARCRDERPVLKEIAPLHFSACHLNDSASL